MKPRTQTPLQVLSPRALGLIQSSRRLSKALLPEGPQTSPYELLVYSATLTLHDPDGDQATFERIQWMRFLQDDVLAVLDHFWGDGEIRAAYDVRHGLVTETFRDQGRRHVVIALPGPMGRGEMAPLWVHRRVEGGFTGSDEWVETMIDHPTRQLQRQVIFPKERPCRKAMVQIEDRTLDLRIRNAGEGRTMVSFEAQKVGVNTPYTIRWQW